MWKAQSDAEAVSFAGPLHKKKSTESRDACHSNRKLQIANNDFHGANLLISRRAW
jgi:hypothetical protein